MKNVWFWQLLNCWQNSMIFLKLYFLNTGMLLNVWKLYNVRWYTSISLPGKLIHARLFFKFSNHTPFTPIWVLRLVNLHKSLLFWNNSIYGHIGLRFQHILDSCSSVFHTSSQLYFLLVEVICFGASASTLNFNFYNITYTHTA